MKNLREATVGNQQLLLAIEHAQPLRHVCERRIETYVLFGKRMREFKQMKAMPTQVLRDFNRREVVQERDRGQDGVDQSWMDRAAHHDWQQNERELHNRNLGSAGIASRNSSRISDSGGIQKELAQRVIGKRKDDEAQAAEACTVCPGADREPMFPPAQHYRIANDGRLLASVLQTHGQARSGNRGRTNR